MTNYWLIIHDLPSYKQHPDKIGLDRAIAERDRNFRTIRNEDRIIYYAKNKEAVGIFKVVSDLYPSDRELWERKAGEYYVYDIEPIYVAPMEKPCEIDPKIYGIKSLQGRTAVKLEREQYKNIKSRILGMDDPTSENGVISLFSKVHQFLGFTFIKKMQSKFPDCIAVKKRKDVRVEFEEPSSQFNHDPKGCDLIVCWEDDLGSTAQVKVLELKEIIYGH